MADRETVISKFEKIISVCKEDGCDFVDLSFEDAEQILATLEEQEVKEQLSDAVHETAKQFQQTIVRCKDCRYGQYCTDGETTYQCYKWNSGEFGMLHEQNWFCADGERRTDESSN